MIRVSSLFRKLPVVALASLSLGAPTATLSARGVVINEILASNRTGSRDARGERSDWIELHNGGEHDVDLTGYALENGERRSVFPALVLPSGGYLVVRASGRDDRVEDSEFHANFKLSRDGEQLTLRDPMGRVVDHVSFGWQARDVSLGRRLEADSTWATFDRPTPGTANSTHRFDGAVEDLQFSPERDFHDAPITVTISSRTAGADIRYTVDGTEPTRDSARYEGPFVIKRTTVLRARAFKENHVPGRTFTHSYLIGEDRSLPALSLVADPDGLFGTERGIYSNATRRGRAWERPASVELLPRQPWDAGGFQADCGVRIHGGSGRRRSPKKAFRLYFRSEYGTPRLRATLFPGTEDNPGTSVSSFDRLVLRAGFNDSWGYDRDDQRSEATFVRDELARRLQRDMGHFASYGLFAHLFINGEYWGIYNLCERVDASTLAQHLGHEAAGWDVVKNEKVKEGSAEAWSDLRKFVEEHDLARPADYAALEQLVDLENFADYFLLNIWLQNYDWPHHNWYAARPRAPGGRWLFFAWDTEYSLGTGSERWKYTQNTFSTACDTSRGLLSSMFVELLGNETFRRLFVERLEHHLQADNALGRARQRLTSVLDEIEAAVKLEEKRWGDAHPELSPRGYHDWKMAAEQELDVFLPHRTAVVYTHLTRVLPKLPPPAIDPGSGRYRGPLTVRMRAAAGGAAIHFTTDGKDPTSRSRVYAGPFEVHGSTTIRAMATMSARRRSSITEAVYEIPSTARFVRGDVDGSGYVHLADVAASVRWLLEGRSLACEAAADVDGDRRVGVGDPVFLLAHLFRGGPAPRPPYPGCAPSFEPLLASCDTVCPE